MFDISLLCCLARPTDLSTAKCSGAESVAVQNTSSPEMYGEVDVGMKRREGAASLEDWLLEWNRGWLVLRNGSVCGAGRTVSFKVYVVALVNLPASVEIPLCIRLGAGSCRSTKWPSILINGRPSSELLPSGE